MRPVSAIWLLLPLALWLCYQGGRPFESEWSRFSVPISALSSAQRLNLATATDALNGVQVAPGEVFSFNRRVGPRTVERGYLEAPAYLGADRPDSIGGGICLVSSGLYQLALETGMKVQERVPHLQTLQTIQPGLDAAVWYGQADLKFANTTTQPIRIHASVSDQTLHLAFQSRGGAPHNNPVRRIVRSLPRQRIQVDVLQPTAGGETLISRDIYRLATRP